VGRIVVVTFLTFLVVQVYEVQPVVAQVEGPRVVLSSDRKTGERQVQLIGRGTPAYPTVDITCDGKRRTVPLTASGVADSRTVAAYAVADSIAEATLQAVECRLLIPGQEIALPRQQLWAAWASPAKSTEAPKVFQGQVVEVIDGDTIKVTVQGRIETVRYIGIDSPETNHPTKGLEPGGREASEVNRQLVARQQIRLELDVQERDRNGRLLAYVYSGDQMVNAELVRRGYAQAMTVPPNVRYQDLLAKLQREAREQKRGLWADPSEPTTPPAPSVAQAVRPTSGVRPGVDPESPWTCPLSHPIKGNSLPPLVSGAYITCGVGTSTARRSLSDAMRRRRRRSRMGVGGHGGDRRRSPRGRPPVRLTDTPESNTPRAPRVTRRPWACKNRSSR
jgi:endonuclease YncB( thermonuclease family)